MDRSSFRLSLIGILSLTLLSGCARMTSIMRKYDAKTTSVSVDAKQRIVISGAPKRVEGKAAALDRPVVCAEPSPDALSALSSSFGISGSYKDKANFASSLAMAEAAGSIGLRTQSIQLMRDAMYRLCEGYMAGAVDPLAFQTLHRRFQSSMVTILAIEQLTGVTKAQTIVLGGNSSVGDPKVVADMTEKKQQAKVALDQAKAKEVAAKEADDKKSKEIDDLTKQKKDLEAKPTPLSEEDEKALKKAKMDLDTATADEKPLATALANAKEGTTDAQGNYDAAERARLAALAGGGSAQASGNASGDSNKHEVDAKAVKHIAEAVQAMVSDTLNLPFQREFCASVLMASQDPVGTANAMDVTEFAAFSTTLSDLTKAKKDLEDATNDTGSTADKTQLKSRVAEKEKDLLVHQTNLMRPTSTTASCLMYVNASTVREFTDTQSDNYIAQTNLINAKLALAQVEYKIEALKNPNLTPAQKEKLQKGVLDPVPVVVTTPIKPHDPYAAVHALQAQ